jgi:hypothetical protein
MRPLTTNAQSLHLDCLVHERHGASKRDGTGPTAADVVSESEIVHVVNLVTRVDRVDGPMECVIRRHDTTGSPRQCMLRPSEEGSGTM